MRLKNHLEKISAAFYYSFANLSPNILISQIKLHVVKGALKVST
jgi:hypothetical protein